MTQQLRRAAFFQRTRVRLSASGYQHPHQVNPMSPGLYRHMVHINSHRHAHIHTNKNVKWFSIIKNEDVSCFQTWIVWTHILGLVSQEVGVGHSKTKREQKKTEKYISTPNRQFRWNHIEDSLGVREPSGARENESGQSKWEESTGKASLRWKW